MQQTANKNASTNARKLLNDLVDIAGKKIVTGQHTQTMQAEEIAYIREMTGNEPKLRGFELLSYSPNISYGDATDACLTEVFENRNTLRSAYNWAKATDGIVTFTFHWFSPIGGRDKSFYAKNTDFDARRVLTDGSPEQRAFYRDMDAIAQHLIVFREADIPILWRPFHESDGDWFWWGAHGPETARELYKLMYNYYVYTWKLDNLLWVWNCRLREGYPGDEYVDVISVDIYMESYRETDYRDAYEELIHRTTANKVAALAEVGYLPDIRMLKESRVPWAYYMTWSKEFCIGETFNTAEKLRELYADAYTVKLGRN